MPLPYHTHNTSFGYSSMNQVTTGSYNTALGVIKCRECQSILENILFSTNDDKICSGCLTEEKRDRKIDEILHS